MNVTIAQSITDFLLTLNSEYTRRAYRTPLGHLCAFLAGQGIDVGQSAGVLTVDHAIDFVPRLREKGYAKGTFELYLTAVYRFYRYLLRHGADLSAADLARLEEEYRGARSIRGNGKPPKEYSLEAAEAVVKAAYAAEGNPVTRLRGIAIVETLRATGCRVGELAGMYVNDIKPGEGAASILVHGKGDKYRRVYWDKASWMAVLRYLDARQATKGQAVFVSHGPRNAGRALSRRSLGRIVQGLRDKAGQGNVTPHYFRHVFATRALERTGLALTQDMLGHASPATTRVYAKTDEGQRREAHRQVWEEG